LARARAGVLPRSVAEEAAPQAPADPAAVRGAAGEPAAPRRRRALRDRLGAVRTADARGAVGRALAREHRRRLRGAAGIPAADTLRESRRTTRTRDPRSR